jgi:hypothetical protein
VVTVEGDGLDEADETVVVTLEEPTNAGLGATTVHTVTITDDDSAPTVTLASDLATLAEDGSDSPATLTATLSAVSGLDVTVTLATSGTATATDDYTLSSTEIVILAGALSGTAQLDAVDDVVPINEGSETVIVDIDTVTNGTEDVPQQVTVTITDNDP